MEFIYQLNLAVLALDHLVTGAMGLFFPAQALAMYRRVFGITIPVTPAYCAILRPWGALGLFAAAVGVLPMMDPVRFSPILAALIFLLLLRIVIRLTFARIAAQEFGLDPRRNGFHVGLIVVCAGLMAAQLVYILK